MATDWAQKMRDAVESHVPEPVVAVGILQPAGTLGSFGLAQLSPLAASIKNRGLNKRAGGLAKTSAFATTKTAALAITADKLYAFSAKQKGRGWKIGEQLGVWDRSDLRVTTEPGKMATKVMFDVTSTGDHYELEATTAMSKGFHDDFLAEIVRV
jgi:hypothetical protein